jgi:hypothetical protein
MLEKMNYFPFLGFSAAVKGGGSFLFKACCF